MSKGHIIALKRIAEHALPILPTPGNSFGIRLALPSLSEGMVYMTAPASCGFGRLAFSESACCFHNHLNILTQVPQSSLHPQMIVVQPVSSVDLSKLVPRAGTTGMIFLLKNN